MNTYHLNNLIHSIINSDLDYRDLFYKPLVNFDTNYKKNLEKFLLNVLVTNANNNIAYKSTGNRYSVYLNPDNILDTISLQATNTSTPNSTTTSVPLYVSGDNNDESFLFFYQNTATTNPGSSVTANITIKSKDSTRFIRLREVVFSISIDSTYNILQTDFSSFLYNQISSMEVYKADNDNHIVSNTPIITTGAFTNNTTYYSYSGTLSSLSQSGNYIFRFKDASGNVILSFSYNDYLLSNSFLYLKGRVNIYTNLYKDLKAEVIYTPVFKKLITNNSTEYVFSYNYILPQNAYVIEVEVEDVEQQHLRKYTSTYLPESQRIVDTSMQSLSAYEVALTLLALISELSFNQSNSLITTVNNLAKVLAKTFLDKNITIFYDQYTKRFYGSNYITNLFDYYLVMFVLTKFYKSSFCNTDTKGLIIYFLNSTEPNARAFYNSGTNLLEVNNIAYSMDNMMAYIAYKQAYSAVQTPLYQDMFNNLLIGISTSLSDTTPFRFKYSTAEPTRIDGEFYVISSIFGYLIGLSNDRLYSNKRQLDSYLVNINKDSYVLYGYMKSNTAQPHIHIDTTLGAYYVNYLLYKNDYQSKDVFFLIRNLISNNTGLIPYVIGKDTSNNLIEQYAISSVCWVLFLYLLKERNTNVFSIV